MGAASPLGRHRATPAELKRQFEASRSGVPFLVYRDDGDTQRIVALGDVERLTVGRRASNDVPLEWDEEVSRVHAELERVGEDWAVVDGGLSRNGTYVNGVRISGRRRLRDGDELRFGETVVVFCARSRGESRTTLAREEIEALPDLSRNQHRVLVALARPYKDSTGFATPATNKEIAEELHLSVEGVKSTLRVLFAKFGVESVPQNEKRARLVERAFHLGVIAEGDL